jgi:hypothetical protein
MKQISKFLLAILLLTFSANISRGQVLISLLFGEALNSEKIEFGLQGGFNRSYLNDIPDANGLNNFNLGFYFHILMKNDSYLSTGVMVKSTVGASGMATYSIGDEDFDALFQNGTLTKKINIFYVPIMFHQRFNNRWYIEAGPVPGLRYTASDLFETEVLDGDLEYKLDARDQYSRLDFALMGGVGYKLRKQLKSTAVGVNYLYGLVDISKSPDTTVKNSSLYIYVKIPIGTGEKSKKDE